jgi:cysteine-rich repeat protein
MTSIEPTTASEQSTSTLHAVDPYETTSDGPESGETTAEPETGCGDGIIQIGEACDEGEENSEYGHCTHTCQIAVCGDGFQESGVEECDDGALNSDQGACTSGCRRAVCGDEIVYVGVEACDEGGANGDDEACTSLCQVAVCGDGLTLAEGEVCDDGNELPWDGCHRCEDVRVAFMTRDAWIAEDIGGTSGANDKCMAAAANAAFPGTFRAWISAGNADWPVHARSNVPLELYTGSIVRTDGVEFSPSWNVLLTEGAAAVLSFDEYGDLIPATDAAWTNTQDNGYVVNWGKDCDDWGVDVLPGTGIVGSPNSADYWTEAADVSCGAAHHLYCFQVVL